MVYVQSLIRFHSLLVISLCIMWQSLCKPSFLTSLMAPKSDPCHQYVDSTWSTHFINHKMICHKRRSSLTPIPRSPYILNMPSVMPRRNSSKSEPSGTKVILLLFQIQTISGTEDYDELKNWSNTTKTHWGRLRHRPSNSSSICIVTGADS